MKYAIDDLPAVSASRLRALGAITPDMTTTTVRFGEVDFSVGLALRRWPNNGSWSFFVCPCGWRTRVLRLFEGGLACKRCLKARGLRYRVELIATPQRAAYLGPKRLARLASEKPARLYPRNGQMLDRRVNLERMHRRSVIVARRARAALARKAGL